MTMENKHLQLVLSSSSSSVCIFYFLTNGRMNKCLYNVEGLDLSLSLSVVPGVHYSTLAAVLKERRKRMYPPNDTDASALAANVQPLSNYLSVKQWIEQEE